jgi:hypothetical protein
LFNIGFVEAMKKENWDCFIFHDVDLYPEDIRYISAKGVNPTTPIAPRKLIMSHALLEKKI